MRLKPVLFIVVTLLLGWLVGSRHASAQSAIDQLIITETNAEEFPQITVRFRALDSNGLPVSDAQLSTFEIKENNVSINPENLTKAEEGLWIHFVVDSGVWLIGPRWSNAKSALTDFVQTTPWMKDNLDHVALTVVPGSGPQALVPFTANGRDLLPALENFTPPGGTDVSEAIPAMEDILETMATNLDATDQAKFIVLLSAGLETGTGASAANLAERARELQIPIYVIGLRSDQAQPLQQLAQDSGGQFVLYNRLTDLNPLFTQLIAYRDQYEITYRSSVASSGTQTVELIANVSAAGHVSDISSYDVEVNPPRVLVESPRANDTIIRQAESYTENLAAIPPTAVPVVARVVFPDNHLRRLQNAILYVDGVKADELARPNPTEDIEFSWNISNVTQNDTFSLEVETTDELGLVSRSPAITAKVDVIVPEKSESSPDAVATAIATAIAGLPPGSIPPTPITCVSPDPLCNSVERPLRSNPTSFVSLGIALLSLGFAGVVWFNRDKAPVQRVTQTVMRGVDTLTKRYLGPSEAKAYLIVLEGDINVGKALEIYGDTPIGRSKQNAELLFQSQDESSPLSRLHCTIVDEEDHFLLRDEDSANGTFLNGSKLIPLQPEELHEGDEIELARVERGGVKLLFQLAKPDSDSDEDLTVTKQTRSPQKQTGVSKGKSDDPF